MLGFLPRIPWQEAQHKGQRYIFFEKRQKPATNPAPFSNGAKTRPCRERITIFAFFAFSSRFFRAQPVLLDFPLLDTARGGNEVDPDFEELAGSSGERLGIAFFLNLLQSLVRAGISKTGERRGRHYLPVGEEARQRGEVRAAYQGKGRDRKGLHLSQQPTFGGNAGDNGRCGTLLGQQDFGTWQHRVHAGLRKGKHGEESGGNEPDGRDVLMKNGKSEQRERGPYLIIPLCSFCGTDACLRWMKNVRD